MESKGVLKMEQKKEKQSFVRSLRFRIMIMNFLTTVLAVIIVNFIIIPEVKNDIRSDVESNIFNMSKAYGKLLDEFEKNNNELSYDLLSSILGDAKIDGMKSSYVYYVDEKGIMCYHPTESKVGKKVENAVVNSIIAELNSGKKVDDNLVSYEFKGVNKYAGYHITDNHRILVITADEADAFDEINQIQSISIAVSIGVCLLALVLAFVVAGTVSKPIMNVSGVIEKAANFDFTEDERNKKALKQMGETGIMARAVDKMSNQMTDMVRNIDTVKNQIIDNAKNLKNVGEQINEACIDNSATTQQLAASMEETSATTENINTNIENMQKEANSVTELSAQGESLSEEIKTRAESLQNDTKVAIERTSQMFKTVMEKKNVAVDEAKAMDKVQELTAAIMEIATQTNLLALNASIEAARAGEAGKGFAVVASEIGNLATQSSDTVENINTIISDISHMVNNMLACLEETTDFMGNVILKDYQQFRQVGDQYRDDADAMNNSMRNIEDSMESLTKNIDDINSAVSTINITIGEAAEGVTDIADKTTEVVAKTARNEELVSECIETISELDKLVQKFTL